MRRLPHRPSPVIPAGAAGGWRRWAGTAVLVTVPLWLGGCLMDWLGFPPPPQLRLAPVVHALEGLNSPYDDYNPVALPDPYALRAQVVFASNAASRGGDFDIDVGSLEVVQVPFRGAPADPPPPLRIRAERLGRFGLIPATPSNETGPTLLLPPAAPAVTDADRLPAGAVWMYASDRNGRRDLNFVAADGMPRPFFGNLPDRDEAYASYDFRRHVLYFGSNRSGRFQIYRYVNRGGRLDFSAWLGDTRLAGEVEAVSELRSNANDTCPLVVDDVLYFASDRAGGQGGFDLYASARGEHGWGQPRNLQEDAPAGLALNTPANEFRPSVLHLRSGRRVQPVLLFSSDRPGGKGGFDLYLAIPGVAAQGRGADD